MASLERQSSDDEFLNCQTSAAPPMEQQNWPYPSDNLVGSLLNCGRNMASLERQSSDEFLNCRSKCCFSYGTAKLAVSI
ncbi:hypothetical protein ACLKA6_010191 [Drosophila palustris]